MSLVVAEFVCNKKYDGPPNKELPFGSFLFGDSMTFESTARGNRGLWGRTASGGSDGFVLLSTVC